MGLLAVPAWTGSGRASGCRRLLIRDRTCGRLYRGVTSPVKAPKSSLGEFDRQQWAKGWEKAASALHSELSGRSDSSLNVEHILFKFLTQLQKWICIFILVSKFLLGDDNSSAGEKCTQAHVHTYSCTHTHTYAYALAYAHTCTHSHAHIDMYMHNSCLYSHAQKHMHTHTNTCTHTCIYSHMHINMHILTCIHWYIHAPHMPVRTHTCTHMHTHAYTLAYTHTYTLTCTHWYIHAQHMPVLTHAQIHAYTHTCVHTEFLAVSQCSVQQQMDWVCVHTHRFACAQYFRGLIGLL